MGLLARRWLARVRRAHAHRPWLRWAGVGVVSTVVALTVSARLSDLEDRRTSWGAAQPVLVARYDVAPGEAVSIGDFEVQQRPIALLPADAMTDPAALIEGARTWQWVMAGEVLVHRDLAGASSAAARLPPGTRGVVLAAGGLPARPGDSVVVASGGADLTSGVVVDVLAGRTDLATPGAQSALLVAVPERRAAEVTAAAAAGQATVMLSASLRP